MSENMSLITHIAEQTNDEEMHFHLGENTHKCKISSFSLHKALTQRKDQLP